MECSNVHTIRHGHNLSLSAWLDRILLHLRRCSNYLNHQCGTLHSMRYPLEATQLEDVEVPQLSASQFNSRFAVIYSNPPSVLWYTTIGPWTLYSLFSHSHVSRTEEATSNLCPHRWYSRTYEDTHHEPPPSPFDEMKSFRTMSTLKDFRKFVKSRGVVVNMLSNEEKIGWRETFDRSRGKLRHISIHLISYRMLMIHVVTVFQQHLSTAHIPIEYFKTCPPHYVWA